MRPQSFHDDTNKTAYIISRFRERPADYARSFLNTNSPLLLNYEAFRAELDARNKTAQKREDAHRRLLSLRQAGYALNYVIEFNPLPILSASTTKPRTCYSKPASSPPSTLGSLIHPTSTMSNNLCVEQLLLIKNSLRKPNEPKPPSLRPAQKFHLLLVQTSPSNRNSIHSSPYCYLVRYDWPSSPLVPRRT